MKAPRISIASVMLAVIACGIAVAALKNASEAWAGVIELALLASLGVALLGIAFGRDRRRAFWVGFLVLGGGYATMAFAPVVSDEGRPNLITARLISELRPHLAPSSEFILLLDASSKSARVSKGPIVLNGQSSVVWKVQTQSIPSQLTWGSVKLGRIWNSWDANDPFDRVGHGLFGLAFGLIGGFIAGRFREEGEPSADPATSTSVAEEDRT